MASVLTWIPGLIFLVQCFVKDYLPFFVFNDPSLLSLRLTTVIEQFSNLNCGVTASAFCISQGTHRVASQPGPFGCQREWASELPSVKNVSLLSSFPLFALSDNSAGIFPMHAKASSSLRCQNSSSNTTHPSCWESAFGNECRPLWKAARLAQTALFPAGVSKWQLPLPLWRTPLFHGGGGGRHSQ